MLLLSRVVGEEKGKKKKEIIPDLIVDINFEFISNHLLANNSQAGHYPFSHFFPLVEVLV